MLTVDFDFIAVENATWIGVMPSTSISPFTTCTLAGRLVGVRYPFIIGSVSRSAGQYSFSSFVPMLAGPELTVAFNWLYCLYLEI